MTDKKLYTNRNCNKPPEPFFTAHMMAMTSEKLHSKADIAWELAARDAQIEAMKNCQNCEFLGNECDDRGYYTHCSNYDYWKLNVIDRGELNGS